MKKLISLLLFLLTLNVANSTDYYVFNKVGDVRVVSSGKTIVVEEKMKLHDKDVVYIGKNSSLTLTSSKKRQVVIIKEAGQGKIKNLIKGNSSFVEILKPIKSFFEYISGLCRSDYVNEQNEVLRGVSERGDSDKAKLEEEHLRLVLEIIEKSRP